MDRLEIINKKLGRINKVYKYKITLEIIEDKDVILPYGLNYKTSSDYIIKSIGFETLKEVYIYLNGIEDVLTA